MSIPFLIDLPLTCPNAVPVMAGLILGSQKVGGIWTRIAGLVRCIDAITQDLLVSWIFWRRQKNVHKVPVDIF